MITAESLRIARIRAHGRVPDRCGSNLGQLVYRGCVTVGSRYVLGIAVLGAMLFGHGNAQAHFVLTSPPAAYDQNALGDPQKAPPCGDDGTATPTGIVTAYQAGETITISIDETIYHPGHYRVALAVNDPSELPEPPPVTAGDTDCGSTTIMSPPVYPVLADGELVHDAPFGKPQSIQTFKLVNVSEDTGVGSDPP